MMMNVLNMMKALQDCGDISVYENPMENFYEVTVEDFAGFAMKKVYENEELLNAFLNTLEKEALTIDEDYDKTYNFEDFTITVGFASLL